jgi:uncharacterized repeat protein (TIGR04052 family)
MARAWLMLMCVWVAACTAPAEDLTVHFRARVGTKRFACGESYARASGEQLAFSDFRMYVSDFDLIDGKGKRVRLALTPDGRFQSERVALLDFAHRSASSASGTTEVHELVRGRIQKRSYRGLEFTVGVPFADNHQDMSQANAPLDVSSMFWVWRSGYKFLRIDGTSTSARGTSAFSLHLGSTGCVSRAPTDPASHCTRENRMRVRLPAFDPARDVVELQLETLLAGFDFNGESPSNGCESDPDDRDCSGVFRALGLNGSSEQAFARSGAAR